MSITARSISRFLVSQKARIKNYNRQIENDFHECTKHIEIDDHFICDRLIHDGSSNQRVNILAKRLRITLYYYIYCMRGLFNLYTRLEDSC